MCKELPNVSRTLGRRIFPVRLSIRFTLWPAHFAPSNRNGLHRRQGNSAQVCSPFWINCRVSWTARRQEKVR
jgi:hypothetical protein